MPDAAIVLQVGTYRFVVPGRKLYSSVIEGEVALVDLLFFYDFEVCTNEIARSLSHVSCLHFCRQGDQPDLFT